MKFTLNWRKGRVLARFPQAIKTTGGGPLGAQVASEVLSK